jgi:ketosteroid isomerase-like protein
MSDSSAMGGSTGSGTSWRRLLIEDVPGACQEHHEAMDERDGFLTWINTELYEAEFALHNGDSRPRLELWSSYEPISVLGAWRSAHGQDQVTKLFTSLAPTFSDCTSFSHELLAYDLVGDVAYTAGLEHTSVSVGGEVRNYTLRVTQVYRREGGRWKVAHRHADTVRE